MSKIKFNLSKIAAVVIAVCTLLTTMTVAFAAEKKYTVDLNSVSDQQFYDSRCVIRFELEGRDPITVKGDDNLGHPVLMNIKNLGGVTLIPVRAICEALGLEVGWVGATAEDPAHAVISTPNHGDVKLYSDATEIIAEDGTTYSEAYYTFPDGTPIPLCLFRNGRNYVPVRFITSFVVEDATFAWGTNSTLIIKGSMAEVAKVDSAWNGTGVNNTVYWDSEDPLAGMPNTANVIEKYGSGYSGDGNTFTAAGVGVANNLGNGIWIKGFRFTNIDKAAYETAIAMLKDLLDSESATAVVNWLEKADDLGHEVYELEIAGKDASAAQSTWLDYLATAEDQPIKLGNVTLQLEWAGFYNIYIRNN